MLFLQDEFKQWFRAKVHMMSAPGKTPFYSLDLQSSTHLANGDGDHSVSAVDEEHLEKFAYRKPVEVC